MRCVNLLITITILFTTATVHAQDVTAHIAQTYPTWQYGGWCATHTILAMLSNRGIVHDFDTYHAQVLQQPTDYDYSDLSRWATWEQLDARVPEIVTVYTRDLNVIDDQLRAGRPVGVYFDLNMDGDSWGDGHTMTVYGMDSNGYYVTEGLGQVGYVGRSDMQQVLAWYMRVWVLV